MAGRLVSTRDVSKKEISYTDALLEGLAQTVGCMFRQNIRN